MTAVGTGDTLNVIREILMHSMSYMEIARASCLTWWGLALAAVDHVVVSNSHRTSHCCVTHQASRLARTLARPRERAASGPACRHRFCSLQKAAQNAILYLRWKTVPKAFCNRVCPSVSAWVSLCVPKILWTPYLKKNQWRKFHPILVTDVFGSCVDGVKRSMVKVTAGNDHISKSNEGNFTHFGHRCIWFMCWWGQKINGQSYSRQWPYLKKQWREFHPFWSQMYSGSQMC